MIYYINILYWYIELIYYCNNHNIKKPFKETNNDLPNPNTRMQGLFDLHRKEFSYLFPKKNCCAPAPKESARMKNLAQGCLSRLKNLAENQKWTPERALFNDTNERFQLGRTAEKIDLGDNRQNFDLVKPREIVVKFDWNLTKSNLGK